MRGPQGAPSTHRCPKDEKKRKLAAENGYREVLEWARAKSCLKYFGKYPVEYSKQNNP